MEQDYTVHFIPTFHNNKMFVGLLRWTLSIVWRIFHVAKRRFGSYLYFCLRVIVIMLAPQCVVVSILALYSKGLTLIPTVVTNNAKICHLKTGADRDAV